MSQQLIKNEKTEYDYKVMEQLPMISYTLSVMNVTLLIVSGAITLVEQLVYVADGLLCLISESIPVVSSFYKCDE